MSSYFSSFSLNKFTDTITNAAHKTQNTLSTAIANIQLDDPQAKLSLKARKHYLQETLGAIEDISKLPPQYLFLEKKCDSLEKVCRRMLIVTKTFEVEGYDYPPNLSESLSDWWSSNKEGLFNFASSKKETKPPTTTQSSDGDALVPKSFAQAISKAAKDSAEVLKFLREEEKNSSVDDDDEEDEDVSPLIKMFEAWSQCQYKMDQGKSEMDTLMIKEFNHKLTNLVDDKFKNARTLRRKVEDSRLKFDTMRYEVKFTEQQASAVEKSSLEPAADSTNETLDTASKVENEDATGVEKTLDSTESEAQKLLEKLEDEFVSNTTEAVEVMGEITDSSEIINLVKLFHNFQLVYHRQCVQDLENSMKLLNELDSEDA
ncbi:LANO_0H21198g1_1 [Lachancea nothofagi CBS 11611]|uniref:LANO_0H21198g1_1 n=1 Tax=Lachancea nothofagi CBS 11611 TaxID=1266666 RepID=A0A1G4KNJ8_9SACH|nr:LANO_0H21198g1_1 [Lachancea nothofagi CBS 11611]